MKPRRSLIAASALVLASSLVAACLPVSQPANEFPNAITSHALSGGRILAKAPASFCIDTSTRATKNFVMMVNCDVLSVQATTAPKARSILTVSTSPELPSSTQVIDLTSSLGDGSKESRRVPGLIFRKISNQAASRLPGAAATHWRGLLQVNRHVVSFAVYGPEGGTVLGAKGQRLLEDLAHQTLNASQTTAPADLG